MHALRAGSTPLEHVSRDSRAKRPQTRATVWPPCLRKTLGGHRLMYESINTRPPDQNECRPRLSRVSRPDTSDSFDQVVQRVNHHKPATRVSEARSLRGLLGRETLSCGFALSGQPNATRRHTNSEIRSSTLAACALIGPVPLVVNRMKVEPVGYEFLEFELLTANKRRPALLWRESGFSEALALGFGKRPDKSGR
jgi:hypothetical protein